MNYGRPSMWNSIPPVTKNLIIINFILWFATIVFQRFNIDLYDILGMHYWASGKFNPAQIITYMFMHGGLPHIFFNMFALFMFGSTLESVWGSRKFFNYYMITGVGAGLINLLVIYIRIKSIESNLDSEVIAMVYRDGADIINQGKNYTDTILRQLNNLINSPTVGASGSVFGILLAFGWLFPQAKLMLLFLPIPIPARIFVTIYALGELFLGVANFSGDNIAHFAHLGGMLFGVILILYWKKKGRLI